MRVLAAAALMLWASVASADDAPEKMTVKLGSSVAIHLNGPITMGKCDDESIVKIDTSDGSVRVLGLAEGKTLCGFWTTISGTHTIYEVTVKKSSTAD